MLLNWIVRPFVLEKSLELKYQVYAFQLVAHVKAKIKDVVGSILSRLPSFILVRRDVLTVESDLTKGP